MITSHQTISDALLTIISTSTSSAAAAVYQSPTTTPASDAGWVFPIITDGAVPLPPVPTVAVDNCSDVLKHLTEDLDRCSKPVKALYNSNPVEIDKAALTAVSCICSSHWGPVIHDC